ncbi:hypothetical protein E4T38_06536 [Aureobasidium subglaciale]|nr:hypothetical protein E4T38_06536 [Aureobasidium subglaciale]KAI5218977.1 hypothetical protein E4T40_06655 [Aureobasidium subglaciale]KAI5222667.1 hypothetical protein E4T41_06476 [Aureobasidium subglaciale]KAI5260193.1 hypothetical protein E4T46_06188 [Aureobasidium subglaciale]
MCWGEKLITTCPYCQRVTVHDVMWLGCPFGQPLGTCIDIFVDTIHAMSAHPLCEPRVVFPQRPRLDRLSRLEALAVVATSPPGTWEAGSPVYLSTQSAPGVHFVQPIPPPAYALPLPAGWTADAGGPQSELMTLVLQYTAEIAHTLQDLVGPIIGLHRNVAFTNVRLSRVITWCEDFITRIVANTSTFAWHVRQAEDEVAASSIHAIQARTDLAAIEHELRNGMVPFVPANIWHRRFVNLFIQLRRLAGELSPPRPATDYTPGHRRRDAISAGSGSQDLDIPDLAAVGEDDAVLFDTVYDSDGNHVSRSDSDGGHPGGVEPDDDDEMSDARACDVIM